MDETYLKHVLNIDKIDLAGSKYPNNLNSTDRYLTKHVSVSSIIILTITKINCILL